MNGKKVKDNNSVFVRTHVYEVIATYGFIIRAYRGIHEFLFISIDSLTDTETRGEVEHISRSHEADDIPVPGVL
jgi:hypothetical protein